MNSRFSHRSIAALSLLLLAYSNILMGCQPQSHAGPSSRGFISDPGVRTSRVAGTLTADAHRIGQNPVAEDAPCGFHAPATSISHRSLSVGASHCIGTLIVPSGKAQDIGRGRDAEVMGCAPYVGPEFNTFNRTLIANELPALRVQWTVHTMQGSNDRTICCTDTGSSSPGRMGAPTNACSSGPGMPAPSRGEKFHVVGAMIW